MGKTEATLGAHLRQAELDGADVNQALREFQLPEEMRHIWNLFIDLDLTRPCGFGPGAITHGEVVAWTLLTGIPISLWEVGVVRQLDKLYLQEYYARKQPPKE